MHKICSLSPLVRQCLEFIGLGSLKIWAYWDKQHLLPCGLNPSRSYSRVFLPLWNDLVNLCRYFSTGLFESKSSGVGTVIALTGTQFLPVTMDPALFIQCYSTCTPLTAPADLQPSLLSYVLTPTALSKMVQQVGFHQVLIHVLLLSCPLLFFLKEMGDSYCSRWGQGALGPKHPLLCCPHTTQPPAQQDTSGRKPRGRTGSPRAKHCPGFPGSVESDCCGHDTPAISMRLTRWRQEAQPLEMFRWVSSAICKTHANCLNSW